MTTQAQNFPGIYFETVQRQPREVLPRMDIAAFVGFASAGPLHTPVLVDNVSQFRDIFGDDLTLAWDAQHNRAEKSYLGLAVETFFRNGGRRCWIVRVADETIAQTARYQLPGLIRTNGSQVDAAYAHARSPGNWAQRVTASTVLQVQQLRLVVGASLSADIPALQIDSNAWYAEVVANDTQIFPGDLISVNFNRDATLVYLYVQSVTSVEQGVRLSGTMGYIYVGSDGSDVSPALPNSGAAIASLQTLPDYLLFNLDQLVALGLPERWPQSGPAEATPAIRLLRFEILSSGPAGRQQRLSDLGFAALHDRFWGNLPADEDLYALTDGYLVEKFSRKTLALLEQIKTPRFAFAAPDDAADWHYLPSSMTLLVSTAKKNEAGFSVVAERLEREGVTNFDAQLFMDKRLQAAFSDALMQQARSIAFLSEKSAEQRLRGIHSLLLNDESTIIAVPDAIHRRWDANVPQFDQPLRAPQLLEIENTEYTDLYQIIWTPVAGNGKNTVSYTLEWSTNPDLENPERVTITANAAARVGVPQDLLPDAETEYFLTLSSDCPITYYFRVRAEHIGEVSSWSNNIARLIPNSAFLDCRYASAAALELMLEVDNDGSPQLLVSPAQQGYWLRWQFVRIGNEADNADAYELQRSSDRLFADAETIFSGAYTDLLILNELVFFVEDSPDSTYYYRVRAIRRETFGPWSNTQILFPSQLSRTTLQPVSEFSNTDILAIHRALLRACYARGDLFGVLSLPRHYEVQDVLDHYALLKPGSIRLISDSLVPALSPAEEAVITHAGLYYPWVSTATESSGHGSVAIRVMPPDGPIAGKIARFSLARGAWIAPANSPLIEVLSLESNISDSEWARLSASNINIIRHVAAGFVTLSADTLYPGSEFREINVRRLISLLLRIALREGDRYVFESNDEVFQDRVKIHFETVLAGLYERGAFTGNNAAQAYRVVTDASINTPQSIDAGRFIVELHVSPSHALKFIRIRLVQSGPGQLQVQEV